MDLLTIQRRNQGWQNGHFGVPVPASAGGEEKAERINDIVKKVNASKPIKNRWGGTDYPIDVSDYGQFLSTLQCLSWILRDCGYEISYLTRGGLHYDGRDYVNYSALFDQKQSKVLAMVAIGKDGRHFRFSRDSSTLRVRKFDNITRAIAPMSSSGDTGSKAISSSMAKEIVKVMSSQSMLDPHSDVALRRWGRVVQNGALKPIGAGVLKNQLAIRFKTL